MAEAERFSDLDEQTGWRRITPVSLQRARQAAFSFDTITTFLQQYCEGGIPPSFLIRLKLWGGGYPDQSAIAIDHSLAVILPYAVRTHGTEILFTVVHGAFRSQHMHAGSHGCDDGLAHGLLPTTHTSALATEETKSATKRAKTVFTSTSFDQLATRTNLFRWRYGFTVVATGKVELPIVDTT